ncbi:flagellar hook-basal body complex protein FliE [bacterium]|nr:MAG: flagellar hook-basal body complex protein FliE [bacterium]
MLVFTLFTFRANFQPAKAEVTLVSQGSIGDASSISRTAAPVTGVSGTDKVSPSAGQPSFREILGQSLKEVSSRQQEADSAIEALVTGQSDNIAEVMTAVEKADLAFRTLMQFRNKLVAAYEEINRLRI